MVGSEKRFAGKVALVTGSTSGIGQATAELFALQGAAVIVAGRRTERGESVVSGIRSRGGEATYIRLDVTDPESVSAVVRDAVRIYGRLDCAFNNAGIPGENIKDTSQQSEQSWEAVINTNLRGVWLCMKHELAQMCRQGGGAIVNSASIFAHQGSEFGIAPYIASKHGVLGLTRAAAVEFARRGIRINAVSPGITRSEMSAPALEAIPDEFNAQIERNVPFGRIAEAEEIGRAVLWLCSDDASFVTGESLAVDGGWLVR
jgi:A-factor type gamma-butyrolactone 1'-reductase (1S-forming)